MSAKQLIGASEVFSVSPPYSIPHPAHTAEWGSFEVVLRVLLVLYIISIRAHH